MQVIEFVHAAPVLIILIMLFNVLDSCFPAKAVSVLDAYTGIWYRD